MAHALCGTPHRANDDLLGVVTHALTTGDESEIAGCLKTLTATDAGTGFMHESFSMDDAGKSTREWFAWANALFGELILTLHPRHPRLLGA